MSYSAHKNKLKEDTTVSFYIRLSVDGLSEVDATYTDVKIKYSVIKSYNGKYTSYRSVLHETDLFDLIKEDLWYMDKLVLDKIIDFTDEELKCELEQKNWMYELFLSIEIDMKKVKEALKN